MKIYNDFSSVSGKDLELWFKDFFENKLEFKDYYTSKGNIKLTDLDPSQKSGENLELDALILINKTCIILEYTSQSDNSRNKIKKFIRNCEIFVESNCSINKKLSLFGVDDKKIDEFEDINNWIFVFFGTSSEYEEKNYSSKDFPDILFIQKNLHIFKPSNINYLVQLAKLINRFAKNEFLSNLNFPSEEINENLELSYIKLDGKYVTTDCKIKADIYLLKIKVNKLLNIAKVSRYEGIPFILEDKNDENYQRLLIEPKLNKIAKEFIKNDKNKSFPNTITLILSNECRESNNKIFIPKKYGAIEIIDGQHRLFAYTLKNISEETRNNSEILASAIKFRNTDETKLIKYAAKIFCEINSNQAKVKNNLIYLIKYDVLGDRDEIAVAGKIILKLDKKKKGILNNIFMTNSMIKKNRLNHPPIPVPTIVTNDLVPFLKGLKLNKKEISDSKYIKLFDHSREYYKNHTNEQINKFSNIIERYFSILNQIFVNDWKKDSNTHLHSAKYYSAFIRYLRFKMYDMNLDLDKIKHDLVNLNKKIMKTLDNKKDPIFHRNNFKIPSVKAGIPAIYNFLLNPNKYWRTKQII